MLDFAGYKDAPDLSPCERWQLASLERLLSTGWCTLLRDHLDCWDVDRERASASAREWLAAIEARVVAMEQTELEYGSGCLLDLEHPDVADFIGRKMMDGSPFIHEAQIETARRLRKNLASAA